MSTIFHEGTWVGRVWRPELKGSSVVTVRNGQILDVTSRACPTVADLMDMTDPAGFLKSSNGEALGRVEDILENRPSKDTVHLLAPCDLQTIKACGVTFASSMVERVIEERAAGDPKRAGEIRDRVTAAIGGSLRDIQAGSEHAQEVKAALIAEGLWSQYLEVGIGPDAEVFSKSQTLSAVGHNAEIGIHPISKWNNPEPEVVLSVNSRGEIKGATLGNDVNLRDVEGRSALLLSKAKDNNASCAIGPMIRLFDETFSMDNVRQAELSLLVQGEDGFELKGFSSMSQISRDPEDLVRQVIGRHHQYPDGFVLFLGTLFAPTQDRDAVGEGFTHKLGDIVNISSKELGSLSNTVRYSTECTPWTIGLRAFMNNLAARNLI